MPNGPRGKKRPADVIGNASWPKPSPILSSTGHCHWSPSVSRAASCARILHGGYAVSHSTSFGKDVPVPGARAALLLLGQRQKLEAGEKRGKAGQVAIVVRVRLGVAAADESVGGRSPGRGRIAHRASIASYPGTAHLASGRARFRLGGGRHRPSYRER